MCSKVNRKSQSCLPGTKWRKKYQDYPIPQIIRNRKKKLGKGKNKTIVRSNNGYQWTRAVCSIIAVWAYKYKRVGLASLHEYTYRPQDTDFSSWMFSLAFSAICKTLSQDSPQFECDFVRPADIAYANSNTCFSLSMLGKIFSRRHIKIFFLIRLRKQVLTFQANCLQWRQFALKCQNMFPGKN